MAPDRCGGWPCRTTRIRPHAVAITFDRLPGGRPRWRQGGSRRGGRTGSEGDGSPHPAGYAATPGGRTGLAAGGGAGQGGEQ
jgi:hypothetical protein